MAGACDRAPDFLSPSGNQVLWPALGSVVTLNCTASVVSGPHCPLPSVQWLRDGLLLGNGSHYDLHEDSWVKANWSEVLVSSVLGINLTSTEDFRTFTCSVQNISSSSFTLWRAVSGSVPRPGWTRGRGAGLTSGPAGPAAGSAAIREVSTQCTALVPRHVWGGGDERREALRRLRLLQRQPRGPEVRELHPEAAAGAASGLQALSGRPRPPASRGAVGRPPGEPEPLPAPRRGVVRRLPRPGLVQSQLPGGPVPAAGAHAQTHLHHFRGPAARPRTPCAPPAAPASPPGDPAALEARFRDTFLRFLERATVGIATEGAVQSDGGRPPDPAAG
ncbi:single Ig IL-1-related receptor isoform X3 [Orcinus orca]|uniref:single Ig IL-1-related receptor isoform X3 n=1 Tax=Orcinus orca TaxID=9733 RepID=UPI002111EB98|nr:single Ig IL-1-related receptor isoform X3 [Orcinus orca]